MKTIELTEGKRYRVIDDSTILELRKIDHEWIDLSDGTRRLDYKLTWFVEETKEIFRESVKAEHQHRLIRLGECRFGRP